MKTGTTPAIEQARAARSSAECDAALTALQSELTAAKRKHGDLEAERGRLMLEGSADMAAHRRTVAGVETGIRDLESVIDALLLRRDTLLEAEKQADQASRGKQLHVLRADLEAETAAFQSAMSEARLHHAVMDRLRAEMSTLSAGLSDQGRADLAIWPAVVSLAPAAVELPNTLTPIGRRLDNLLARLAAGRAVRIDDSGRSHVFSGRQVDDGSATPARQTPPQRSDAVKA